MVVGTSNQHSSWRPIFFCPSSSSRRPCKLLCLMAICLLYLQQQAFLPQAHATGAIQQLNESSENGLELDDVEGGEERSAATNAADVVQTYQVLPLTAVTGSKDMFRQYLSRGIIGCTANYVSTLQKMNQLIAKAHAEYSECQHQLEQAEQSEKSLENSRRLVAQLEAIGQFFDEDEK